MSDLHPPLRVIAFDFDGTLVDSNEIKKNAFLELAGQYKGGFEIMTRVLEEDLPGDRYVLFERFSSLLVSGIENSRRCAIRLADDYSKLCEKRIAKAPEMEGVREVLPVLAGLNIPLVISSATPEATLKKIVSQRSWAVFFQHIWGTPATKESHIDAGLKRYECQPDQMLYIGDSEADRAAALNRGCRFIGVGKNCSRFSVVPECFIPTLKQLPQVLTGFYDQSKGGEQKNHDSGLKMKKDSMMNKVFEFMDDDRKEFLKIKHQEAQRFIDPESGKIYSHMVERIDCPVCGVDDSVWVFEKAGFDFVKCRHCGLLYVNPQLTAETQDAIYRQSKTAEHWIKVQGKTKEQSWNAEKKYLPALEELQKIYPKGGKLLDVGCSIGQFLTLARDRGWDVQGIELNAAAVTIARKDYGLTVHEKKVEDVGFSDGEFDVVTLWGVLEHLTEPNAMLRTIRRILKKDGVALFFVPNGHSLIIRMTREHNSTVSGRAHLWYFTPDTMEKLLIKNGFEKVVEFSVLPQLHEIEHFLQYNILYQEPEIKCREEFYISSELRCGIEQYMEKNKLGYKLITIARNVG